MPSFISMLSAPAAGLDTSHGTARTQETRTFSDVLARQPARALSTATSTPAQQTHNTQNTSANKEASTQQGQAPTSASVDEAMPTTSNAPAADDADKEADTAAPQDLAPLPQLALEIASAAAALTQRGNTDAAPVRVAGDIASAGEHAQTASAAAATPWPAPAASSRPGIPAAPTTPVQIANGFAPDELDYPQTLQTQDPVLQVAPVPAAAARPESADALASPTAQSMRPAHPARHTIATTATNDQADKPASAAHPISSHPDTAAISPAPTASRQDAAGNVNATPALGATHHLASTPLTAIGAQNSDLPSQTLPAVSSHVGSAEWGNDLGRQLLVLSQDARQGRYTAELRLDPPDLGPLRVTLSLADGTATASFVSAHAAVRSALESALPQLQQAFSQAGLSLAQSSVSDQGAGADSGQQASQQSQHQGKGASQQASHAIAPAAVPSTPAPLHANALVDIYA